MNKKMEDAYNVALSILKPDKKDLDHGLKLHAESIVCDAYGFSPHAACDGDAVKAAVEAGASESEIKDMFENMAMTRFVTDRAQREEFMDAWQAAGVTCILQNAGEEYSSVKHLIRRLAHYTYVTDMMSPQLRKAVKPDDIVKAKKERHRCLYLTCNAVPMAQDWVSVEEEMRYIELFYQLGCRMMHLTYNRRNLIGDGCAEPADAGLSDFGRAVIAEMNRVGVIVDVAHSGQRTSLEAARISARPMVASHSVARSVNHHIRGKSDEVIRAIADSGGYVGICAVPAFLGHSGDIRAFLDHIEYVAKNFGPEHVAIGMDRAYGAMQADAEYKKIPERRGVRRHWVSFWPKDEPLFSSEWNKPEQQMSLEWTNWPLFTVGLVQRGFSDNDIRKIIGGNVLRVAMDVLKTG